MLLITECRKCKGFEDCRDCPTKIELSNKLKTAGITKEILRYRCHRFLEFEEFADLKTGEKIEFAIYIRDDYCGDYYGYYTGEIRGGLYNDKYYSVYISYKDYKNICKYKHWEDIYEAMEANYGYDEMVDITVRMSNIIRVVNEVCYE